MRLGAALTRRRALFIFWFAALAGARAASAPFENPAIPDEGKLPLTAGFTDIDGAGGAGLVPWAIITGYGTEDSYGANAHYTLVSLGDFRLRSYGIARRAKAGDSGPRRATANRHQ
jgi:hypothetical protein